MSQLTPGKRARDRYIPFNNDPKNVGTRSGMIMPQNLPRREGLEDPAAYFNSPDGPSGSNRRDTMNSTYSRATYMTTPGARTTYASDDDDAASRGDMETPGTARRVSRAGRGRMSDLDFEEGMGGGDDLLQDEDDLAMATPGSYFPGSNPPSVSLPSSSRLNRASPATHTAYDALPSPSPSKSRPTKDPRKSHLVPRSAPNSAHKKSGLSNGRTARASESEEERARSGSRSDHEELAPTPSPEPEQQAEAEPQANYSFNDEPGPSNFGADDTVDLGDEAPFDDDQPMAPMDDYDVQGAEEEERRQAEAGSDSEQDEEDNGGYDEPLPEVEMEQDGSEQEQGSEEEEERAPVQKKKSKGRENAKTAAQKKKDAAAARRKDPVPRRERSQSAQPRRARLSELDANGNGVTGNFLTRRSGRQHIKPLEYWRGEKVVYAPGPGLAIVSEVVTIPEESAIPFAARNKRRGHRAASASKGSGGGGGKRKRRGEDSEEEEEEDEAGWDDKTEPTGLIQDFPGKAECHRKIACPKALLVPKLVQGGSFKYQKVFGEGGFMAAGVVYVPVGEKKNTKPSKDNAYVFYVIQGAVQVTIYRTSFVMAPGSQFLVPRGNDYCIENISPNKEAQLFFAQARKIRAGEEEEEGIPESQGGPAMGGMSQEIRPGGSQGAKKKKGEKKVSGKGSAVKGKGTGIGKGKRLLVVREESGSGSGSESGSGRGSDEESGSGSEEEESEPEPMKKKKAKARR
ncbi:hypothetical protein I350_05643 [Cryptococcus amylolentus CBS 6273]|uniref:CENP-C homolog n=1 Tax=Cryptococcus amylolentus CBS 6273 TaxID=1296118 RepID=A0A1E3JVZ7_9TREE|nr:hypothetical protein I350_05643 [Cryptococcus amylolentus CBS 6273]